MFGVVSNMAEVRIPMARALQPRDHGVRIGRIDHNRLRVSQLRSVHDGLSVFHRQPVDAKRNMMNASSNYQIISGLLRAVRSRERTKLHIPGALGELGGYPAFWMTFMWPEWMMSVEKHMYTVFIAFLS